MIELARRRGLSRHPDGTVHFSLLKYFARSPAHYAQACRDAHTGGREPTRAMRVGTAVHVMLFGMRPGHVVVCAPFKTRLSQGYKDFAEEYEGADILTEPEWEDAKPIAAAVRRDPVAAPLLVGRYEVPLRWTENGVDCATGGVDVIGDGWIADLKTTTDTAPSAWSRKALAMQYAAQLMFYAEGCRQNRVDTSKGMYLIGVEDKAPYAVTVLRMTPDAEQLGRRCLSLWLEQLRACEASDDWPAYVQAPVDIVVPAFMTDLDDEVA